MPHANSGHSPFDLMYGFRVRTPLDVLYFCLLEGGKDGVGYCSEWVLKLAEKLDLVRDQAALNTAVARVGRMAYLNKGSMSRSFKVGDRVLYRIPGRASKLSDSWEGPYVVQVVKGKVNYKIAEVGKETHMYTLCTWKTDVVRMCIETGSEGPVRMAPYSVPLGIRAKVKDELETLESHGIIERSDSSWASPLVPVRKPDGGVRLCVDYRRLNAITVREPYFIPSFTEMVELVGHGQVLSKIDLAKGFHLVVVDEADRDKTAFVCPFGKFRYVRMPFGLTNAPAVFQRTMDLVLRECMGFSRVYIDDVLVVSKCWQDHVVHLECVFRALQEAGLKCKLSKCSFGKRLNILQPCFKGVVLDATQAI